MNDKCAAGCGRFSGGDGAGAGNGSGQDGRIILEFDKNHTDQQHVHGIRGIGSGLRSGNKCSRSDIINGIHQAIAKRVSIMVDHVGLAERVVMSGGVAKNIGVVRSLEKSTWNNDPCPQRASISRGLWGGTYRASKKQNFTNSRKRRFNATEMKSGIETLKIKESF